MKPLDINNLNLERIVFSPIKDESTYNGKRVNLSYKYDDGSVGNILIKTLKVGSLGVSEFGDQGSSKKTHSLSLFLWGKNGPTEDEIVWVSRMDELVGYIKNYFLSNKKELKLGKLQESSFGKFSPLKQNIDEETGEKVGGPALYPKIWATYNKETGGVEKMYTKLYDDRSNNIIPLENLIRTRCLVKAAIRIESVYFNAQGAFLNVKLLEARVTIVDQIQQRLLSPSPVNSEDEDENESNQDNGERGGQGMLSAGASDDGSTDEFEAPVAEKKRNVSRRK